MSMVSARDACIEVASIRVLGAHLRGWVLTPLLAAAAVAAGGAVYLGLRTPGEVIRRELTAAGSELGHLPWSMPSDSVQRRITPYFAAAYGTTVIKPSCEIGSHSRPHLP
jgi:hypothetical protein